MASKRTFEEEDHQCNDDRDLQLRGKRRHGDPGQAEAMHLSSLTAASSDVNNKIALYLEPVLRKVMQEMIPPMLQRYISPCCRLSLNQQSATSGGRALQLCFMNKLLPTIFSMANITAEDGGPLQIELRDAVSQQRIVREERYPMKIQICVLDGDFGSNGNEDWTAEEFNAQTRKPREGKGPLLNGDTVITLKKGVGSINKKIVITDSSCWTRTKTFRLGVKIVQSNSIGAGIREGRSEPFEVKDSRGEAYKKHDRPSLNDELWRLKHIAKDGRRHRQLSLQGIRTVKDLLQLNITNQASLREKIGNIAGKSWDEMIAHAKNCNIDDDKGYFYHSTEQLISLFFNCIYEVVGVSFYGQNCRSLQSLNLEEERLVERVKKQAYENLKDLVPIETTTHDTVKTLTGIQAAQYDAPDQGLHQLDFVMAQQGQPEMWSSTSKSIIDEAAKNDLVESDHVPVLGEVPLNWSAGGQFVPAAYIDDGNRCSVSVSQIDQFESYLTPNQWVQVNPYSFPYGNGAESNNDSFFPNTAVYISSKRKSKTVWQKVRSALKWVIPHVAKKKAKFLRRQY